MEDFILLTIVCLGLLVMMFYALKDQYKVNRKIKYREQLLIWYLEMKIIDIVENRTLQEADDYFSDYYADDI